MITTANFRSRYMPKAVEWIDQNDQSAVDNAEFLKSGIWKMLDSKTEYDDVREKESMGPLGRVEQGAALPERSMRDGFEKRLYKVKYAAMARYTAEVLLYNRDDVIADYTKGLAGGRAHTLEILNAAVLEYGHLPLASVPKANKVPIIDSTGADGNPLFFGAHPYLSDGAGTWKNRSDTLLDFTRGNIQAVSDDIDDVRLSNNAMSKISAAGVVIPTNMRWSAYEMFKSDKQSETANNSVNSLRAQFGSGDYFVYRWLESKTDWYVKTTAPSQFKVRTALAKKIEKGYDGENQTHWISNTTIFGNQVHNARSLYKVTAA